MNRQNKVRPALSPCGEICSVMEWQISESPCGCEHCFFVCHWLMALFAPFIKIHQVCWAISLWETDLYQKVMDGRTVGAKNQSRSRSHSEAESHHVWWGCTGGRKVTCTQVRRILKLVGRLQSLFYGVMSSFRQCSPAVLSSQVWTQFDGSLCLHELLCCRGSCGRRAVRALACHSAVL